MTIKLDRSRYWVEHDTRCDYAAPVTQSWQLARLSPRELPWQSVLEARIDMDPPPDERHQSVDSFGNTVTHFGLYRSHTGMTVSMRSLVEVGDRPAPFATQGRSWEDARQAVLHRTRSVELVAAQLVEPTRLLPLSALARSYAGSCFGPGRDWLQAVHELMMHIHQDFEFDATATTVSTSVDELLAQRRGVCQDFAHLMITCLRAHGLPARYVSGYLLTEPPPGSPRLMGVDASHAWVAAYSSEHGWVEFDPTNGQLADRRYITIGWGADFADIGPLRGVLLGSGSQRLAVSVSVIPVAV